MNISQLIRSVIGDLQVSDAKSLELKVGQVVRGMVLQMLSEQDALVNIGGVQVRARLETPLAQGQATLLQVQPESVSGQVVLKPLDSSGVQIAERSLPDLLKGFELKDNPSNRRAIGDLHQAQVPLTKETAKAYTGAVSMAPEGADEGQWREAAMLAVKRGLPVTQESVTSLHRTLFGKPLDQALEAFDRLLGQALSAQSGAGEGQHPGAATRALMGQIRETIGNLAGMARQLAGGEAAQPEARAGAALPGNAPAEGEARVGLPGASAAGSGGAAAAADPEGAAGRKAALPGAGTAGAGNDGAAAGGEAAAAGKRAGAGAAAGSGKDVAAPPSGQRGDGAGAAASSAAQGQEEPAQWIGRLLKALGVEHEQQLAPRHERASSGGPSDLPLHARAAGGDAQPPASSTPQAQAAAEQPQTQTADTLKGMLLSLSAADDAPAAIREGAQQLVQQVTGQQLLLTPDRAAMFSHMTLMLPLVNSQGSQTAAVHIQSRKGARGELDSSNCHLIFDLNMKTLGNTLIDVQVTDRIVGLRVHNDFPEVAELLEEHRDDIREGLEKVGYQFLSLKVLPYPEPAAAAASSGSSSDSPGSRDGGAAARAASLYNTKPYKGVDLRV